MVPHRLAAPLLALLAAASGGCVERTLHVRSEPSGLDVTMNGMPIGRTPLEVPFTWYGTVRLESLPADLDGDGWAEVRSELLGVELATPWYEWFPLDFITENLLPFTLRDRHEVVMRPAVAHPPESGEEVRALRDAAEEMRRRAEKARLRAEEEKAAGERKAEDR